MGTYIKLSKVEGLRESDPEVIEYDRKIKRFFNASKVVGVGKESAPIAHAAFSPNGSVVSMCSATKTIFYDYVKEKIIHTYSNPKEFVRCVAFRSDGKVAAVSDNGGWIQLVALGLKTNLRKWRAHDAACHALMFSPSKLNILSGSDDGVAKLWDTVTGEMIQQYNFHTDKIRALANLGGSGHWWVTGGYDHMCYLFDAREKNKFVSKINHGAPVECIDISTSNKIMLTAGGNKVNIWDVSNGFKLLHSFEPHQRTVVRGYIRDCIITASLDGTVRYYNYSSLKRDGYSATHASDVGDMQDEPKPTGADHQPEPSTGNNIPINQDALTLADVYFEKPQLEGIGSTNSPKETDINMHDSLSDYSTFVTPRSSVFSAGDNFTPMNENTPFRDEGVGSPLGKQDADNVNVVPQSDNDATEDKSVRNKSESTVSLRHVYRFNDAVTAFAVSVDARSIAVGTSNGEWIIRFNPKEETQSISQPKKIIKVDETVLEYKSPKLSLLDRLVKTFQYQAAMDLALSLTPQHVYNLVESLVLRGSLATAVRGKDEQTILPLLKFISSQLGSDVKNTNTLLELGNAIIDNNGWLETCDNSLVIQELRKIPTKINFELYQHNILHTLDGTIDLILSRSTKAE
ncbi:WD domain G-beta repeat family protein [Babesia bovis T2Bo]|uniref:WD domain, G-beta repeat containing protein n=1 Tax=Babesia bovis TaxID=5865 RepID=A7AQE3_BABBO|nr:WD domain G-beta repeat family protein [Babesia bovis T2Bo]EDO06762.1 WD domain G-beta repeat family protein [Babesia bovis T2Bo]|eukprot:XP_001610330.1 WD domain, G-beta repeat containing protein [Babesia bovis T2Bo]